MGECSSLLKRLILEEDVIKKFDALEREVSLVKRVPHHTANSDGQGSSKEKVPEPKPFGGAQSAKKVENFIWDMEQYFRTAHIPEGEQVKFTSMYLAGDAKLWSRRWAQLESGRSVVET